jgi:hypothetical protein
MAEDEDSARDSRSKGIGRSTVPKPGREMAIRRRNLDAEFWQHAIEKLNHAAKTGNIRRGLAAQLATALRLGCAGQLPASWVRLEVVELSSKVPSPPLEDQRLGAAMYRYAAEKGYISDTAPVQTIKKYCNINKRTWNDWSGWLNSNIKVVENELEMLLLEAPFLLQDLEEFRCTLLFKADSN